MEQRRRDKRKCGLTGERREEREKERDTQAHIQIYRWKGGVQKWQIKDSLKHGEIYW